MNELGNQDHKTHAGGNKRSCPRQPQRFGKGTLFVQSRTNRIVDVGSEEQGGRFITPRDQALATDDGGDLHWLGERKDMGWSEHYSSGLFHV